MRGSGSQIFQETPRNVAPDARAALSSLAVCVCDTGPTRPCHPSQKGFNSCHETCLCTLLENRHGFVGLSCTVRGFAVPRQAGFAPPLPSRQRQLETAKLSDLIFHPLEVVSRNIITHIRLI